jgi:hypothetical protein
VPVLELPKLRPDQRAIVMHPAKRKNCTMGRRYGKSVMGGVIVANVLRQHGKAAWVVPTYKNSRPLWRWMAATFAPLAAAKLANINRSEQVITTSQGGFFAIYSEENIDAMRGEWFHVVVNDEAAKFREESRYDVIEPTVADSNGEIIDISTPRGRNWFWREHMLGLDGAQDRASFHAPTNANPMPSIQRAFKRASEVMSEDSFRQEWLAEFLEGQGAVFRNIGDCLHAPLSTPEAHAGHRIVAGCDWAKQHDYTSFSFGCMDCKVEVDRDRFNKIDYAFQVQRLEAMCDKWQPKAVLTELNSIGQPVFEALDRRGLPVIGFETTAASKPPLIENLALAFERSEWQFQPDPIWTGELEAYERKVSAGTGRSTYGAPEGLHDDTVISRALMVWQAMQRGGAKVSQSKVSGRGGNSMVRRSTRRVKQ